MARRGQPRRGQSRGDHWQAAPRSYRHRRIAIRGRRDALRQSRYGAPAEFLGGSARPAPLYARRRAVHNALMARARKQSKPAPVPAPEPPETGGTLTIDLKAIEANWRALAHELLTVECAAVVKANAYGLGLEPVTAALAKAGCKTFFVADLAEARRVRGRARDATIYVLNGWPPEGSPAFVELNARPVINSMTELAEWDAFVAARNWQGGAALQVDTGMNRLGSFSQGGAGAAARVWTGNHRTSPW